MLAAGQLAVDLRPSVVKSDFLAGPVRSDKHNLGSGAKGNNKGRLKVGRGKSLKQSSLVGLGGVFVDLQLPCLIV